MAHNNEGPLGVFERAFFVASRARTTATFAAEPSSRRYRTEIPETFL